MPSTFRKIINAVKDQTSIQMLKLNTNYLIEPHYNLEATIIKATSHEEEIPDDRYIKLVIATVVSSPKSASSCVRALIRRILGTQDYIVAVKSLMLIFRALRDEGPYFALELKKFHRHFLKVSNFSTSPSYSSTPWDFTAFVRTYARYLDNRLESAVQGKLHNLEVHRRMAVKLVNGMSPSIALAHIEHWQRLLDCAISMKPTGTECSNRVVQVALYMVVYETFDLYQDISASLNLLHDKFFSLNNKCRIKTVESCKKACKQFKELDLLYAQCIEVGVGRVSEYPSVQMISKTLVRNLEENLHDGNANANVISLELSPQSQSRLSLQTRVTQKSEDLISDAKIVKSKLSDTPKKHPIPSALKHFDQQKETTTLSNLPEWEQLLVEMTSKISNSANGSLCGEEIKMVDDHNRLFLENHNNPFLQGFSNIIEEKNVVNKIDGSLTVGSDSASSSNQNELRVLAREKIEGATRQVL